MKSEGVGGSRASLSGKTSTRDGLRQEMIDKLIARRLDVARREAEMVMKNWNFQKKPDRVE